MSKAKFEELKKAIKNGEYVDFSGITGKQFQELVDNQYEYHSIYPIEYIECLDYNERLLLKQIISPHNRNVIIHALVPSSLARELENERKRKQKEGSKYLRYR